MTRSPLDRELLSQCVARSALWTDVQVSDSTGSTNTDAAEAARRSAGAGLVITTDHQASGKGRLDRGFLQPAMSGVTVSVVLRPETETADWSWLPLIAGLAVADTVRAAGVDSVALKWPNDVLIDEHKVCGILLERVETPAGPAAVIGMGINVTQTAEQLPVPTAVSLRMAGATELDRTAVCIELLQRLEHWLSLWPAQMDQIRSSFEASCDTLGRTVRIELPGDRTVTGVAEGIDPSGALIVDGTVFAAGDVTHVRPA